MPVKLSIVDQAPVSSGMPPSQALRNSIDLARLADTLGYTRYWIAEHHAMPGLASPAPEILIARVGAETSRIRIGSGGVLLPHYAPLKVAEQFRMLHALYPGRLDLGIGRAPGGTMLEASALQWGRRGADPMTEFPEQLLDLLAFLGQREFPSGHRHARIHVAPHLSGGPVVWLLGSSMWSAEAAAQASLPYAFAHFIAPQPTRRAIEHYRANYRPRPEAPLPRVILALGAICADTQGEAERLYQSTRLMFLRLRQGDLRTVPSPEEAEAELPMLRELEPALYLAPVSETGEWPRYIVGDSTRVCATLTDIAKELGVDELMVVTITHDHQARRRSYELLAEALL